MGELTYEDFKNRISMQQVLEDAGYHFNRRDGYKCPSFVRLDSDGRRIRGDKFILSGGKTCCYQPPDRRNYNVISFIQEHPDLFAEYKPGMNKNRLVNLVCNRLLNQPISQMEVIIREARTVQVFDEANYEMLRYDVNDWDIKGKFYGFFKDRGLDLRTQAAFADHFFLATNIGREDGKRFTNLAFPFYIPNNTERIVGLEERGRTRSDSKSYKGKAAGTNSIEGGWIANLSGQPLEKADRIIWFESAYDAMGRYQVYRDMGKDTKGVYISLGGNPSDGQFKGVIETCPEAVHYLGFDMDRPGQMYACLFAMMKAGKEFSSYSMKNGTAVFIDKTTGYERYEFSPEEFSYENFCKRLGVSDPQIKLHPAPAGYKDWNEPLMSNKAGQGMPAEKENVKVEPPDVSGQENRKEEETRSYGSRR